MRTDFVSLHTHSTYSYGDGYGQPADYVARALELQMPAICLTEHGNVSSHVKLEQAIKHATSEGFEIKGMYGCELYTRDVPSKHKFHLGAIAMNDNGYRNLLRMVSASWRNFYYFPTTTSKMAKQYGDDLIILSGCMGSAIACKSLGGKDIPEHEALGLEAALRVAASMLDRFGDRYYLEVQAMPELEKTHRLNQLLVEVSRKLKIPLVATLDAHYPRVSNQKMHSLVHAIARGGAAGKKTVDQQEGEWNYDVPMTLFGRQDVGKRLLATGMDYRDVVAALDSTVEIAERCNVILPQQERVRYPTDRPATELLWDWLRDGWRARNFGRLSKADQSFAVDRLKYEVEMIIEKDFTDYFLVLSDVVRWAKNRGIVVGPARGSAAASLVCFLLRITEINPLEYRQMYFERFIAPERIDLPDVDLDFDDERRDEIRRYLQDKFGVGHVGNIGTYTKWRGKNSIDDVARVTGVSHFETTRLKEFIIERSSGDSRYDKTLEDTIEQFPLAKEIWDRNPSLKRALELEGMYKAFGVHSAGLVVSNVPLTDAVALYTREVPSRLPGGPPRKLSVLSVDKKDAEYLGMMKIDFLGLTTLGMIRNCLEFTGMTLDELYALPMNDPRIIDAFNRGDVKGIFQFEGRTTRMVTAQLKPDNFQELVDINALSRPGPFHSGQTLAYINRKHGKWDPNSEANHWTQNPVVRSICGYTKDQMIYQEQLLAICRDMASLSWVKLAEVRKIISLKYGEAAFNAHRQTFIDGAVKNGHDAKEADSVFRHMITAGQYSFNLAHSVSYTKLGYWSMFFKIYHPAAFYAASLRKASKDRWSMLLRDAIDPKYSKLRGDGRAPKIGNCDLDISSFTWTTTKDANGNDLILPGFSQIPGIGTKLAALICAYRDMAFDKGETWTRDDLGYIPGIGPKKMATIIEWTKATQDDPFGVSKLKIKLNEVRQMLAAGQLVAGDGRMLPMATHKSEDLPFDIGVTFDGRNVQASYTDSIPVVWIGVVHGRNLRDLFEEYRSREGHDLDPTSIKEPNKKHSMVLYAYDDTDEINVRISRWKFPRFKDTLMKLRLDHDIIVVDGFKNKSFGRKIEVNNLWAIDPE